MTKAPKTNEMPASLLDAAKTSAEGVRTLTGEALGAAAAAAATVVMSGVAKALNKGEATVTDATPAVTETVKDTVTGVIVSKPRKRRAAKRPAAKKRKVVSKRKTVAAKKSSKSKKKAPKATAKTRPQAKRKSPAKRKAKKSRR